MKHYDSHAQPAPTEAVRSESVTDAVIHDLEERRKQGTTKYGTELKSFNGRDALVDAYQEALDLCCYLKQALLERDEKVQEVFSKPGEVRIICN